MNELFEKTRVPDVYATLFVDEQLAFFTKATTKVDKFNYEQIGLKPVYLAMMADVEQLKIIMQHRELFDLSFVQAVERLIYAYDDLKIEKE